MVVLGTFPDDLSSAHERYSRRQTPTRPESEDKSKRRSWNVCEILGVLNWGASLLHHSPPFFCLAALLLSLDPRKRYQPRIVHRSYALVDVTSPKEAMNANRVVQLGIKRAGCSSSHMRRDDGLLYQY